MNTTESLADAFRKRANFLRAYPEQVETRLGDINSVVASLYEMADVVDSWSEEYLSKEETHEENMRRRWGSPHWSVDPQPPMTMEERVEAVRKPNKILDLE